MDVDAFLDSLAIVLYPLGDRVAVLPDPDEEVSAGGIHIPDSTEKEPKQAGTVIAIGCGGIGDDCPDPSDFLVLGDRVLFGKFTGDDVNVKKGDGSSVKVKILHLDAILSGCNPKT